jgi:hypothetical protein
VNGAAAWNARTASSSSSLDPDGDVTQMPTSAPLRDRLTRSVAFDSAILREGYAMFLFAKSQWTMFQNASMNLGRALR